MRLRAKLRCGLQAYAPLRYAHCREGSGEQLGSDPDQLGPATPGLGQGLGLRPSQDRLHGSVHDGGVGPAEAEDRLLLISNPDRPFSAVSEPQEDGELDRARVLELVHQQ